MIRARAYAPARRGIGAYVQFLINNRARVLVVADGSTCWILSNGRIAKKSTEGSSWIWAQNDNNEDLSYLFSGLRIRESERAFYSFGDWGYHTTDHESQVMAGFTPTPPGREICGTYQVIYVAALAYDTGLQQANILLRRQPKAGSLVIQESNTRFVVGVDGRIGSSRGASRTIKDRTMFYGQVRLPCGGGGIDRYFGPGYNFYGFETNSEAALSYPFMASNASLIVTKRNDNKGRIYRVDSPKAFKLVHNERGIIANEVSPGISQEQEANEAKRICKYRHFSFLCRDLGLPCSVSALVTSFLVETPPYIFAQPGDIWIDIRLSTPNRTYVLARPHKSCLYT